MTPPWSSPDELAELRTLAQLLLATVRLAVLAAASALTVAALATWAGGAYSGRDLGHVALAFAAAALALTSRGLAVAERPLVDAALRRLTGHTR